ncbi:MAG TPA: hypothetical protein VK550_05935 [Polyangiaceae bacterium]|nr:hypothetical protein [Polyangiaceae bacterium]
MPPYLAAALGATFALTLSCRSAGPYGYSRVYAPTRDEAQAVTGKSELDARGLQRSPDQRNRAYWAFGVVTHRSTGPGGAAYVALSLRTLLPQNQCKSPDEDTCRVTVTDRETGRAHALVTLTADDDLGEHSVALGSLLRVVGTVAEDVDPTDGSAILRATFYRHWPRGFYSAGPSASPATKR